MKMRFAEFEANFATGELRKHSLRVKLYEQSFRVLAMLLIHPGELVTREELREQLWPTGTFVDFENGLNSAVNRLRNALGDTADNPKFIETIPRRGYRFIAPVESVGSTPGTLLDVAALRVTEDFKDNRELASSGEIVLPATRHSTWFERMGIQNRPRTTLIAIVLVVIGIGGLQLKPTSSKWTYEPGRPPAKPFTFRSVYVLDYNKSAVLGYSVNPSTGILEPINTNPFSSGEHPYGAALTPDRDFLYVANRGRADGACGNGCNISGYAVETNNGGLIELDGSPYPAGSGPVSIAVHPAGTYLYVAHVISNDLYVYARNKNGDLRRVGSPVLVGTHPFFVTITPSGKFLYVCNQDDATISAFTLGDSGTLRPVPGSPFATGLRPRSIMIDPQSRFAYVINYGVNPFPTREDSCDGKYGNARGAGCSITIFRINQSTGALAEVPNSPIKSDGINPHAAVLDAQGKYLFVANINSNNIGVYRVTAEGSALVPVPGSPFSAGFGPSSVVLDWSDRYLYVVNTYSRTITQFRVENDGQLEPIGKQISAGMGPINIVAQRGQHE